MRAGRGIGRAGGLAVAAVRAARVAVVAAAALGAGCAERGDARPGARAPKGDGDASWVASPKLDADVQELVLRAYDEELAFPFRVRADAPIDRERLAGKGVRFEEDEAGGGGGVARCRPADLAAVVAEEHVVEVHCARAGGADDAGAANGDDGWRPKVSPDVRTVFAARSGCFVGVYLRFGRTASVADRGELESMGVLVKTFDAASAVVYAPIDAVPGVARVTWVASVEPMGRAFEE